MGCWNGTCMVTRLPILSGEKVKLVLLFNQNVEYCNKYDEASVLNTSGMTYSNSMLSPAFLPLSGEYDDYGTIEDIVEDINYNVVLKVLKDKFGSKIKIDMDNIIEDWSLDDIIRGIERGGCRDAASYWVEKTQSWKPFDLSFVFIREDVYNFLAESMLFVKILSWKHEGYIELGSVLKDNFKEEFEFCKENKAVMDSGDKEKISNFIMSSFRHSDNCIFRKGSDGTSFLLAAHEYDAALMQHIDNDVAIQEINKLWTDYKCLETFMGDARIAWMIQSGS
ncbi:MAG: hypothetical protein RLZZ546_764, partial [Bacteroidota bacterium]